VGTNAPGYLIVELLSKNFDQCDSQSTSVTDGQTHGQTTIQRSASLRGIARKKYCRMSISTCALVVSTTSRLNAVTLHYHK